MKKEERLKMQNAKCKKGRGDEGGIFVGTKRSAADGE